MVDTVLIFCKINQQKLFDILMKVNRYLKNNGRRDKLFFKSDIENAFICYGFAQLGLQEIKLTKAQDGLYKEIQILFRPKLLIDKNNYIDPTYFHEFIEIGKRFDHLINDTLKLDLQSLFSWKVKRIDYAIDLYIDERFIPLYIKLFKMADIPDNMLLNETTLKYFDSDLNAYLKSNSVVVNIYDRFGKLSKDEEEGRKNYYNVEAAKGKLRIEIQCHKIKTNNIKAEYGFDDKKLMNFLDMNICRDIILHYYKDIIGTGDFFDLNTALYKVSDSNYKFRDKSLLRKLLRDVCTVKSIWEYKRNIRKKVDNSAAKLKVIDKQIAAIRKLNINPVTIPSEFDTLELINPIKQIKEYFEAYADAHKLS